MSYPIYSETFVRTAALGSTTYTVPWGYRAVVKSITVMSFAAPPAEVWIVVAGFYVAYFPFQVVNSSRLQELMAIAREGSTIVAQLGSAGMHTTVSGFLLREVAGGLAEGDHVTHDRDDTGPGPELVAEPRAR